MHHYSRSLVLGAIDEDSRTVEASVSSTQPVFRPGMGNEVLDHRPESIDLSRAPLPLLTSHDHNTTPVGIVEGLRIAGGKLRGTLRFGTSVRAAELWGDVKAGILRNVSIGYEILDHVQDGDTYRVTRWMPYEVSMVAIPADATVGIGRSFTKENTTMNTTTETPEKETENLTRSQRRAESRAAEEARDEIANMLAIGDQFKRYGSDKLARKFISEGKSFESLRLAVLKSIDDHHSAGYETITIDPNNPAYSVGYRSSDISKYSLIRAVNAAITGDWSQAGLEREIGQEEARATGRASRGIFVPVSALATRVMKTDALGTGGALVPTQHMGFIDMLRPYARVLELGATVLPGLIGGVEIPKQSTAATAEWLAEDGALGGSDLGFDSVLLNPKTCGAMTSWSRRMVLQSVPGVEEIARRDLAAVIGLAVDRAALHGPGNNNQPTGLYAAAGVSSVAMGGVPTYGKIVNMVGEVAANDALTGSLGFITSPGMAAKLSQTLIAAAADADMIWDGAISEGKLAGYPAFATNQVRSDLGGGNNEHGILFGNWAELIIGQWGGAIDLLVDPYTYADRGRVRLTAFTDLDIAVRHGESFCKATGATV